MMRTLTPRQRHLLQGLIIEEVRALEAVLEYSSDEDLARQFGDQMEADKALYAEMTDLLASFLAATEVTVK